MLEPGAIDVAPQIQNAAGCWLLPHADVGMWMIRMVEQEGKTQAAVCWQFLLEVLISAEKVSKPQRAIDLHHTVTRPL